MNKIKIIIFLCLATIIFLFNFDTAAAQEEITEGGVAILLNTLNEEAIQNGFDNYSLNDYTDLINSLTDEEKELIARITFREAGNQDIDGQMAVVEVILNRVLSDKWPDTVYKVLSQKGQFSTWSLRNKVSQENIEKMLEVIELVANEKESILIPYLEEKGFDTNPLNYVYFDGVQHSYATNYIKIQGHWFGTSTN